MFGYLSRLFHLQTANSLPDLDVPKDKTLWPKEWKTVNFKSYPRMPQVLLPKDGSLLGSLKDTLMERRSSREFTFKTPVRINELSVLLHYSTGIIRDFRNENDKNIDWNKSRRFYPSGGSLYPLEVYLSLSGVVGINSGLYHYNLREHSLEKLVGDEGVFEVKQSLTPAWAKEAPVVFIVTAVWDRNFGKYHDFGYRVAMLEAGHLSQNVQLVSTALNLKYCALNSYYTDKLSEALDLQVISEAPIHVLVIGR